MATSTSNAARSPWRRRLRRALLLSALFAVILLGRPVFHLTRAAWVDAHFPLPTSMPTGEVDDASGLERARMREVWSVPADREAAVAGLRAVLARAADEDLAVSIAGARHSMGGHTITPGGVQLDMTGFKHMSLDADARVLRVGSGALWSEVLAFLDPEGFSVAIMQSNDSFTVGGSLSVNCHGWQHASPPIAASVRSLRLVLADGSLVECSREQNAELFSLVLGGYGLFGVIVDADLEVVPNELYRVRTELLTTKELGQRFLTHATATNVGMAMGRLDVAPANRCRRAVLRSFERVDAEVPLPAATRSGFRGLRRTVLRGSVGSDYGKALRWTLETRLAPRLEPATRTRNSLLSEPVDLFANHDPGGTDVLHESFVPHDRLDEYLTELHTLFAASPADLLNVTVRDVRVDEDSFLRYADQDMFSLVMLFHMRRDSASEAALRDLTREMIDAALRLGGRHYLPYRRHATREQFERAYPMAQAFFEAKRRYDPDERFQNQFYEEYGAR